MFRNMVTWNVEEEFYDAGIEVSLTERNTGADV